MSFLSTVDEKAWFRHADGLNLRVRLTPSASANRMQGVEKSGDGLTRAKVAVTVVPEKGKANKALIKILSKHLGVAQRDIDLVSGATDRNKTLLLKGDADSLEKTLKRLFAPVQ
ncbi:DUF167 family protein [Sneathiella aquimaris]|uniref:DUF167 family protein n=1 Tax=Sneathiella aquimaris TaxID=2599305 RepID=UPI00146F3571|nr:DUF167 family protein [Sneathiella aquimaris]